jgi:hypothetical protein
MTIGVIWVAIVIALVLLWRVRLMYGNLGALVAFGPGEADQELKAGVVRQYQRQQKIAFTVLILAVLASLAFASYLVWRLISVKTLDLQVVSSGVGVAADLFLGRTAFQLYREVSDRLEKLLT